MIDSGLSVWQESKKQQPKWDIGGLYLQCLNTWAACELGPQGELQGKFPGVATCKVFGNFFKVLCGFVRGGDPREYVQE